MVQIKRFQIAAPRLNPWIILGELSKLGDDKKKLFKDSHISDRHFLNFCFTRQNTCPKTEKMDILKLYDIDIFEVKKKSIQIKKNPVKFRQGFELLSDKIVTKRTLFIETDNEKIFLYDFKVILETLKNQKPADYKIAKNYDSRDFAIRIAGLSLFNGPAIIRLEELSSVCRNLNRNVRLFEKRDPQKIDMEMIYEFESKSEEKDEDLDLFVDKIDPCDPYQILKLSLIYDENIIKCQILKCDLKNCGFETRDKANFLKHKKACLNRSKEIVPVLKGYGLTMNPIVEAIELGFLPERFLDFKKTRISKIKTFSKIL
jgi:hypothetical protein